MKAQANSTPSPYQGYGSEIKVVTVCRLHDKAKGLFRMLNVHKRLNADGIRFLWFVVGDGADRQELEARTRKAGMNDRFIVIGGKENPFPYYKHADVSATLSYYEGLCGAVNEAKALGKPVIASRFSGIEEQITHEMNGLIVENNEQAIFDGMKRIICDTSLRTRLSNDIYPPEILDDSIKIKQIEILTS
jgi:glycosyltransferase involved in cell wall biosynthesis